MKNEEHNPERRRFPRERIYYLIKYKDAERKGLGTSINLSASGVLLRSREPFKLGERLRLEINFINHPSRDISLEAEVVRVEKKKAYYNVAFEFKTIDHLDQKTISEFISFLAKILANKAKK